MPDEPASPAAEQPELRAPTTPPALPKYTRYAAAFLTVAWLSACGYLLWKFGVDNWDHALVLYNGLMAVDFTAAGVLLGTQVQDQNAIGARHDAAVARQGEAEAIKQKQDADARVALVKDQVKAALAAAEPLVGDPAAAMPVNADTLRTQLQTVRQHLLSLI